MLKVELLSVEYIYKLRFSTFWFSLLFPLRRPSSMNCCDKHYHAAHNACQETNIVIPDPFLADETLTSGALRNIRHNMDFCFV